MLPSWRLLIALNVIAVLLVSCVFNFAISSVVLCLLDGGCANKAFTLANGMYSRTMAIACLLSYSTLAYRYRATMPLYEKNVRAHDTYSPTTVVKRRDCRRFYLLCFGIYLVVILPINTLRVISLYTQHAEPLVLVFFVIMYMENISLCVVEVYFATLCRELVARFSNINRDLERLGEEIAGPATADEPQQCRVVYRSDFYGPPSGSDYSIANAVEIMRIRHRLIRDAVYVLVDLFGMSMAMSLITLCVLAMFDIYYQVFDIMGSNSRPLIYIYMWLLQYSIRFCVIVVTAHNATKQVY